VFVYALRKPHEPKSIADSLAEEDYGLAEAEACPRS
jgi:hypothetical protein